ncbi:MAG: hypothetical protein COB36_06425 [Alphaproteobacteria bacterium]|nr:MAG: hypothetical protein COB36_06425 [Alphaproteobacteria bacterium]
MTRNLNVSNTFNISTDHDFDSVAKAFPSLLSLFEKRSTSVMYYGEELHHPGQIGVIGRARSGKSNFLNTAINVHMSGRKAQEDEIKLPRTVGGGEVQVYKRWITDECEIRIQDEKAISHLLSNDEPDCPVAHTDLLLPDFDRSGIRIMEHPEDKAGFCDMLLEFYYDDDGQRFLKIKTTDEIADSDAYQKEFLPSVECLEN